MWIDVLSWTHTSPPAWCQAFIHTMTPFLNPLPNKTWEEEILKGYPHLKYLWMCVSLLLKTDTDTSRSSSSKNELHKMSEEKRVWVPFWSYYWGQLLGFTAVEQGFDLCRFSRETHLHNIKISTSPTLKRPGAWPGNSKDPQNPKEEFFDISLC